MTKKKFQKYLMIEVSPDLLKYIERGRFKPFTLSDNMKNKYRELSKEKGIPNPLDRRAIREISNN